VPDKLHSAPNAPPGYENPAPVAVAPQDFGITLVERLHLVFRNRAILTGAKPRRFGRFWRRENDETSF
jgi:hypothetical protein